MLLNGAIIFICKKSFVCYLCLHHSSLREARLEHECAKLAYEMFQLNFARKDLIFSSLHQFRP
jgi:hypothetical protein